MNVRKIDTKETEKVVWAFLLSCSVAPQAGGESGPVPLELNAWTTTA